MALHGKNAKVYANGYLFSDYLNSIDSPNQADTVDVTPFNSSGEKQYVVGHSGSAVSAEGFFDGSSSSIESTVNSVLGTTEAVVWNWYPNGDSTGEIGFGIETFEHAYDISSPVDGAVSISIEAINKIGGRDRVVSLRALANQSSSAVSATNDNTATSSSGTTGGGVGYYQRTDDSTRGLAVTIQHSSSDVAASFSDLITFTTGQAKTAERIATASTNVKPYLRTEWTMTGATSVATAFHVSFNRK